MKKTAEKVIFSTIYTVLIALVVTYICHRELEPTPSVNYERSQDAVAYMSDIQNHTHWKICRPDGYNGSGYGVMLEVDRDGIALLVNSPQLEHPNEMLCYAGYNLEARIVGMGWNEFLSTQRKPQTMPVTLYYVPSVGSTEVTGNATHPITRGKCTLYDLWFDDGTAGELRIDEQGVFIRRFTNIETLECDEYTYESKYGDVKNSVDIQRIVTERDLRNSRAAFEEIAVRLQALDIQSGDTRDILTNLITILKDCSSK